MPLAVVAEGAVARGVDVGEKLLSLFFNFYRVV